MAEKQREPRKGEQEGKARQPVRPATFQSGTGDESVTEQERARGRFESEPEPTQLEEDFGERGLHTAGGIHDSAHEPSILDPREDEDE